MLLQLADFLAFIVFLLTFVVFPASAIALNGLNHGLRAEEP